MLSLTAPQATAAQQEDYRAAAARVATARAVVVCPQEFRSALRPWIAHRKSQGYTIDVIDNNGSADELRGRIRRRLGSDGRRFILLVGDVDLSKNHATANAGQLLKSRCVPTHHDRAEVNVLWGSPPHIATDNWFADLDDDRVPDVAIGRLTPDTPEQLRLIVNKIIAYERSADCGPWRRRLNFVAGVGGFGLLADTVIESVVRDILTRGIPAAYRVSMTQGSWRSPYCPDPRLFHQTAVERLNEGAAFWVYIGHGHCHHLDRVVMPDGQYHILANRDIAALKSAHGLPIAIFLSCYAGAFDVGGPNLGGGPNAGGPDVEDCLAEEMLRAPGGPVAIVAGSRVGMPYAMAVLMTGMMDECFQRRVPTLGEAFLAAKRRMVDNKTISDNRKKLDALAAAVSPMPKKLAAERAEHLAIFNIIGDPMLRLRHPKAVTLRVPVTAQCGQILQVSGTSPIAGRATVELVARRDRFTVPPPRRPSYPTDLDDLSAFQAVYKMANDHRFTTVELTVPAAEFKVDINVPQRASGVCNIRIFVRGEKDFALGSANIIIKN